jgi:hypothetical protein
VLWYVHRWYLQMPYPVGIGVHVAVQNGGTKDTSNDRDYHSSIGVPIQ